MKITISESALSDLDDGYYFYENQKDGLGKYFEDTLFSDIDSLRFYAGIHTRYLSTFRMLSKRFPFAVYYTVAEDIVTIKAVLDCRRSQRNIKRQVRKRLF